jgi:hypothetical protein
MKKGRMKGPKGAAKVHDDLVGKLVSDTRPVRRALAPGLQWAVWFLLSSVSVGSFLLALRPQDMGQVLCHGPSLAFLLAAYLGSALAAWEAICSGLPGRQTSGAFRSIAVLVLVALFAMPFLFFTPTSGSVDLMECCASGWSCIQWCCAVGFLPWVALGVLLARNASLQPLWTGAWSGLSAFLLGTLTVQLHCPSWEAGHMVAAHLFPVALLTFPAALAGSFWFSRWRR